MSDSTTPTPAPGISPLPKWEARPPRGKQTQWTIWENFGKPLSKWVCKMYMGEAPSLEEEYAKRIVLAVNNFDALREALRAAVKDRAYQDLSGGAHFTSAQTEAEWKHESSQKAWALAKSALAAAGKGEK